MDGASKSNQQFCLRWHNHQASLLTSLPILLNQSSLTDVTLSAEGKTLQAHRVVLSACSNFFAELFRNLEQSYHPVIILPGAKFPAVVALISFMYSGETNVFEEQIPGLLILAEALGIKGLADLKHNNIQNVNKILKINEDKVQMYHFDSKTNEDNRNTSTNIFPKKCIYSNIVPAEDIKIPPNFLGNCEQYYNYLSRPHDNPSIPQENIANPNEILQNEKKILNNINNFNQITEILRCLSSSSIAVSNLANELSIMKSSSENVSSGENSVIEKKPEEDMNFFEDSISVEGNSISSNLPVMGKPTSLNVDGRNKIGPPIESIKPCANSKLYATCFICQKQLSNQYNLRVHLETHQNVRYSCSVCPHVSRSKDALRKHVSYRHSNNMNCYEMEPRKKRSKLISIASDSSKITTLGEHEAKLDYHNNNEITDDIKAQGNCSTKGDFSAKGDCSTKGDYSTKGDLLCQITSAGETQMLEKSKLNLGNSKNNNLIKTIGKPINDIQHDIN